MNEYYVYTYFDPRKQPQEPIYVGKGHGDRFKHHITKGASNKHLANKLRKISEAGLEPIIEFVQENMTNEFACALEVELIAKYGRADKKFGPLCNWTDGGEGTPGYKHSDETKKLFSEQRKGKKQTEKQYAANCSRKPVSDETKKKISLGSKRQKPTPEHIEAIKLYNSTREITDDMRAKWSKTRLNNTPTKANYPPIEELLQMIENSSMNKVAKQLGVQWTCLSKYLKRRNIQVKDARYAVNPKLAEPSQE